MIYGALLIKCMEVEVTDFGKIHGQVDQSDPSEEVSYRKVRS